MESNDRKDPKEAYFGADVFAVSNVCFFFFACRFKTYFEIYQFDSFFYVYEKNPKTLH